jgi:hypothetical protein
MDILEVQANMAQWKSIPKFLLLALRIGLEYFHVPMWTHILEIFNRSNGRSRVILKFLPEDSVL